MDFKRIKEIAELGIKAVGVFTKNNNTSVNKDTIFCTKDEIEAVNSIQDPDVIKEYFQERLRYMRNFNTKTETEQKSNYEPKSDAFKSELIKYTVKATVVAVLGLATVFGFKYIEQNFKA
jgi:hypothetical protein|nr:MAG TPA: hypothetical protein [Caudoviricetes sp.]